MCGVPFHAAETYINRLVSAGYKVAICEQMEDPKKAKGIVKREVIKVVTPGTNINTLVLSLDKNTCFLDFLRLIIFAYFFLFRFFLNLCVAGL